MTTTRRHIEAAMLARITKDGRAVAPAPVDDRHNATPAFRIFMLGVWPVIIAMFAALAVYGR